MSATPIKCFVHITSKDRPGFVEFNFSIGDPDIYLEMILPVQAFDEFCQSNQVTFLTDRQAQAVARQQEKWRDGEAGSLYPAQNNQ